MPPIFRVSFPSFFRRTTLAFNKHVIRKKTAGSCITDGAVLGISEEGTTHADGSLFQHLVMHIAQNLIPMLNNQYKQYRCYSFFKHSFLHNMHLSTHNTHLCLSHMFRWTVMVYVINVSSFRPHSLTIILPAISKWKNNNQSLTIKKHFFFFLICAMLVQFYIYYTQNIFDPSYILYMWFTDSCATAGLSHIWGGKEFNLQRNYNVYTKMITQLLYLIEILQQKDWQSNIFQLPLLFVKKKRKKKSPNP